MGFGRTQGLMNVLDELRNAAAVPAPAPTV